MRLLAIALACLSLAGCVASLKKDLAPYNGQPATVLFDKLGFPTDQKTVADHKIYVWSTSRLVPSEGGSATYYCTIRAIVSGPTDIITNMEWEGNLGGCNGYMSRLGDWSGLGVQGH